MHLPYLEGLIHLVGGITRLLGADADYAAGAAAWPPTRCSGRWSAGSGPAWPCPARGSPFEAGVGAVARRGRSCPGLAAASWLGAFAARLGSPVPGLPAGLTHAFPSPAQATPGRGWLVAGIEGA